jgi:hypothetical protein
MKLSVILWGIPQSMRACAAVYPKFAARLKERDCIAQFQLKDQPKGRWIQLKNGKISSRAGIHANPDFRLFFKNEKIAESFLTPPFDHARAHRRGQELQDRPCRARMPWWSGSCSAGASMESYTWKPAPTWATVSRATPTAPTAGRSSST